MASVSDLTFLKLQTDEHEAWKTFINEWRALGLPDINDAAYDPMVRSIEVWAERLVTLRGSQSEATRAIALADKMLAYERAKVRA